MQRKTRSARNPNSCTNSDLDRATPFGQDTAANDESKLGREVAELQKEVEWLKTEPTPEKTRKEVLARLDRRAPAASANVVSLRVALGERAREYEDQDG